jgi:hypothetical protein
MAFPEVSYSPRPDATPDSEVSALAAAYRLVLDSTQKKGARPGAPNDAEGRSSDGAKASIRRTT